MINLLYQTYLIVLPIILGYIIWLLKEQKQKQINDAKARDERIQEEYKKMHMRIFVTCTKHIMHLVGMELARNCMKKLRLFI